MMAYRSGHWTALDRLGDHIHRCTPNALGIISQGSCRIRRQRPMSFVSWGRAIGLICLAAFELFRLISRS